MFGDHYGLLEPKVREQSKSNLAVSVDKKLQPSLGKKVGIS